MRKALVLSSVVTIFIGAFVFFLDVKETPYRRITWTDGSIKVSYISDVIRIRYGYGGVCFSEEETDRVICLTGNIEIEKYWYK